MKNSQETKQSKLLKINQKGVATPIDPKNLNIKIGDAFILGDHLLLCRDATNTDLMDLGKYLQVHAIITDPPYAVDYVASKKDMQNISKDKDILNDGFKSDAEYIKFTKSWLIGVLWCLSGKNSIYIFNCDKMVFALRQALVEMNVKVSQMLIWVKNQAVIGRLDYLPQHELILYGWHHRHNFRRGKDKSVIFEPKPSKSKLHPSMKPISLMRKLILNSTNIGNIIYDPFGGSGSTLIACEQLKRKCIMVEMDPEYCEVIIKRYLKLINYGRSKQK